MSDVAFVMLSALLSVPVGLVISRASITLPNPETTGHERLSRKLALVLTCAALALWAGLIWPGPKAFLGALLGWQLLMLALLDAEHFWLPRPLTIALIASGLAFAAALSFQRLSEHLLGAAVGFSVLAALSFLYRWLRGRDGLGGGDTWLLAGGGAWTGWQGLPTILVLGSGAGLVFVAFKAWRGNPIGRGQPIPLGVGLAIGTWFTWLYGPLDGHSIFG